MSVTIKDIAREAKVSYATVSRALSDHPGISERTKIRVRKIAKEMGYTPNALAKGLVTRSTYTIGFVVPDITNPFFPEVAQGVEEYASRNGYHVLLCNTNWQLEKEKEYMKTLHEKRVDGIVAAPVSDEIDHILEEFSDQTPVVFAACKPAEDYCNYVVTDDYQSAVLAAEYLIKLGHERIAYIGGLENSTTDRERFLGYRETMDRHQIPLLPSLISHGQFKQSSGYESARRMLAQCEVPTAVLAGNDFIALGVIQAIEEFGLKVPKDISVIGIDDISFASLDKIQLTSVFQPKFAIGELCVQILLDKIRNPHDPTPIQKIIQPELVIRKTCKGV